MVESVKFWLNVAIVTTVPALAASLDWETLISRSCTFVRGAFEAWSQK